MLESQNPRCFLKEIRGKPQGSKWFVITAFFFEEQKTAKTLLLRKMVATVSGKPEAVASLVPGLKSMLLSNLLILL